MSYSKPILFLDIDGVLACPRIHGACSDVGTWCRFDPIACKFIERQCIDHGLEVVISSTWRKHCCASYFRDLFGAAGFSRIRLHDDWRTRVIPHLTRGHEIQAWLDDHLYEHFIIVDDDSDMLERQAANFIRTDCRNGMLEDHYVAFGELMAGFRAIEADA